MTAPFVLGDHNASQTSAGTTQATATTCFADHVLVSSPSEGSGVVLKAGNVNDFRSVTNGHATNSMQVYPPSGAGFNGQAANTALTLPPGRSAWFIFFSATTISAVF